MTRFEPSIRLREAGWERAALAITAHLPLALIVAQLSHADLFLAALLALALSLVATRRLLTAATDLTWSYAGGALLEEGAGSVPYRVAAGEVLLGRWLILRLARPGRNRYFLARRMGQASAFRRAARRLAAGGLEPTVTDASIVGVRRWFSSRGGPGSVL